MKTSVIVRGKTQRWLSTIRLHNTLWSTCLLCTRSSDATLHLNGRHAHSHIISHSYLIPYNVIQGDALERYPLLRCKLPTHCFSVKEHIVNCGTRTIAIYLFFDLIFFLVKRAEIIHATRCFQLMNEILFPIKCLSHYAFWWKVLKDHFKYLLSSHSSLYRTVFYQMPQSKQYLVYSEFRWIKMNTWLQISSW